MFVGQLIAAVFGTPLPQRAFDPLALSPKSYGTPQSILLPDSIRLGLSFILNRLGQTRLLELKTVSVSIDERRRVCKSQADDPRIDFIQV